MVSPIEKALRDPNSMKAKILTAARKLFGKHGYSGTTTRMIAKSVGIDISTLYYHWGEKADLYEAVLKVTQEELKIKLLEIEKIIHGKPLSERLQIAIDMTCDYYFSTPEVTNLVLLNYFTKPRDGVTFDFDIIKIISGIAVSMGLAIKKEQITTKAKARVLAVLISLFNFIAGEKYIRPIIGAGPEEYISVIKETLKYILVPAFTRGDIDY